MHPLGQISTAEAQAAAIAFIASEEASFITGVTLHPASLGGSQRLLHAPEDGVSVLLGHGRHDAHVQAVGLRYVYNKKAGLQSVGS